MKVDIQATHDTKFSIETDSSETILSIKQKISNHEKEAKGLDLEVTSIRLIFSGKILKDTETIEQCKIHEGNTIHMVKTQKKATPAPAPVETPAAPSAATTTPAQPPANMTSLLQNLGAGGAAPSEMPPMPSLQDTMGMQQMFAENPEMMDQVFDMISANPELLRSMMAMNPQFQSMPPEVQNLMLQPAMLRMIFQTMGNPRNQPAPSPETTTAVPPFQNLLSALQAGGFGAPHVPQEPVSNDPPNVRFASQLAQLREMGFYDEAENIQALLATGGNVNAAIERLLANNFA